MSFVSMTMWRTYAAWMEGALETDIALIQELEIDPGTRNVITWSTGLRTQQRGERIFLFSPERPTVDRRRADARRLNPSG
jgi:hypothetical protein